MSTAPTSQSTADLMAGRSREYLLLAAKDGGGKSTAVVSIAAWVQSALNAAATFYVIDTENKFPTALRSFGADAPTNIAYYKCESMIDVGHAFLDICNKRKPDDWLAVESMARVWEKAQDLAYQSVSGYDKETYLNKRRELATKLHKSQVPVVIPKPDDFWSIAKGAHDSEFLDIISQAATLNVVLTTTLSKPPKEGGRFGENVERKAARVEFGLDAGMDGAPRLPTYVETACLLDIVGGKHVTRIMRDNLSKAEEPRQTFEVDGRKSWATAFWSQFRM